MLLLMPSLLVLVLFSCPVMDLHSGNISLTWPGCFKPLIPARQTVKSVFPLHVLPYVTRHRDSYVHTVPGALLTPLNPAQSDWQLHTPLCCSSTHTDWAGMMDYTMDYDGLDIGSGTQKLFTFTARWHHFHSFLNFLLEICQLRFSLMVINISCVHHQFSASLCTLWWKQLDMSLFAFYKCDSECVSMGTLYIPPCALTTFYSLLFIVPHFGHLKMKRTLFLFLMNSGPIWFESFRERCLGKA